MSDYVIGSGLSEQDLKLASWWVRNGHSLKKIGQLALIIFSVVCWGYGLWSFLDAYAISYPRESRITQHIAQNQLNADSLNALTPQPVQSTEVNIFQTTGNRQDFLVQLSNANPEWWAEFDYHFDADGEPTPTRKEYILPNSQRYVTETGWKGKAYARNAALQVENVQWHRIIPSEVNGNYENFFSQHQQLQMNDIKYQNDLTVGAQTIGRTTFTLVNPSGFGFWEVNITAILARAGNPVGVTTVTEREIKPGESRPVTIDWFENLPGISRSELQANVNILTPKSYLPSGRF